ncbi:MAG: hypothetical protein ACE5NA_07340 [Nitrospiraceae bacterium]
MDMLEFLGTWETSDGEWVDPFELEESMTPPAQFRTRGETDPRRELDLYENSDQDLPSESRPELPSVPYPEETQEP